MPQGLALHIVDKSRLHLGLRLLSLVAAVVAQVLLTLVKGVVLAVQQLLQHCLYKRAVGVGRVEQQQ